MEKSATYFETLEDAAVVYFGRLGFLPSQVRIKGAFGGSMPTEDDDIIFITEENERKKYR